MYLWVFGVFVGLSAFFEVFVDMWCICGKLLMFGGVVWVLLYFSGVCGCLVCLREFVDIWGVQEFGN